MYMLYDTEKELFFDDYRPLQALSEFSLDELSELLKNLENACQNAFMYGSALLEIALYDDIETVQQFIAGKKGVK